MLIIQDISFILFYLLDFIIKVYNFANIIIGINENSVAFFLVELLIPGLP